VRVVSSTSNRQVHGGSAVAFTLIEVVLAIAIALGILVVVLYFYEQSTNLRTEVIQETERVSAARLVMDRLTGELRSSQSGSGVGGGFVGDSNTLQFVKTDVPSFTSWTGGALGRSSFPMTDLKLIKYRIDVTDGTNAGGLVRTEEPLVTRQQALTAAEDQPDQVGTNVLSSVNAPPVLEEIKYVQFRYWSGTNWLDSWIASGAPEAVEVSLGAEVVTNATEFVESPPEIFRRVIYLGGAVVASNATASTNSAVASASSAQEGTP
jgi:type II secretory pathway pseudopilin PulG